MRNGERIILEEGSDYSVSYSRNTDAAGKDAGGSAAPAVTVKGRGSFSGKAVKYFTIGRRPVSADELMISVPDIRTGGKPIDSSDIRHSIKFFNPVLNKTVNLTKGRDYEIAEFSFAEGKQLQKVSFRLKGNYANDGEIGTEFLVYQNKIKGDGSFEAYP